MHRLRSAILKGEKAAAAVPAEPVEACRRKGARDPSRQPSERKRDDRRVAAQRRAKRLSEAARHATILYGGKRSLVRVVNVSASGLTVESAYAPRAGDVLRVELEGHEPIDGVVRWARRGRIGIDAGEGTIAIATDAA